MIKRLICLTMCFIATYAQAKPPEDNMHLIWFDEFTGSDLDTRKWQHRFLGPRKGGVTSKDAVSVVDGNLRIQVYENNGVYHGGMISTEQAFQFKYGYIEYRARIQKELGFWTAGWLQSSTMQDPLPVEQAGAEIDVFEALVKYEGDVLVGTYWGGYGPNTQSDQMLVDANITDGQFHTFGLRWTPDKYEYYLDDELIWTSTKAISQTNEYIILSAEIGSWGGDITKANLPDDILFDYIRVYQNGSEDTNPVPVRPTGVHLDIQ